MSPKDIKNLRTKLGLTQKDMAEALGVAKLTISHYETGFRTPGPTLLILFMVLDSFSKKSALELLGYFKTEARKIDSNLKGSNK